MRPLSRLVALVAMATCALFEVSSATQIRYQSVEQLGARSTVVVSGTVTGSRSYWNDTHTKIFTETQISVDDAYKGTRPASVSILQLGGVVDGVRVTVSGALHWRDGEEVLLFLEPYANGSYQVSGFSQGKFQVERDPDTGERFIRRPELKGAEILGAPDANGMTVTSRVDKVALDKFVQRALGK